MYCDVPEAAFYLNYQSPASLYRLLKAGLLDDYVEMHDEAIDALEGGKAPEVIDIESSG